MNKSSVLVCPSDKLLNPESIKAFAESHKDNWNLFLVDHHPDLKVAMDNLYGVYIAGEDISESYKNYVEQVRKIAEEYQFSKVLWAHCNDWIVELEWIIEDDLHDSKAYIYDQMMAYNTLISSLLPMTVVPNLIWLDARDHVRTDDHYGQPELIEEIDWSKFDDRKKYVSQSYLGSTSENNSTIVADAGKENLWVRSAE